MVMEMFSCLIDHRLAQGGFSFHPKCKELNVTHVIFADDLSVISSKIVGSSNFEDYLRRFWENVWTKAKSIKE